MWRRLTERNGQSNCVCVASLVQGDIQCSGRILASVRSQSDYGLLCCIYLFETINSVITSSSNGLRSATIIAIIVEKCASFNPYVSKTPQIAATASLKCQQHNHLHRHHLDPKFSQHSIFRTWRNSIVHFLTSAAETNPKERHSKSRCWFFVPRCVLLNKGRWLNQLRGL